MNQVLTHTLLNLFPGRSAGSLVYRAAKRRWPPSVLKRAVGAFVRHYDVNMDEVVTPEGGFSSFDDFFTRRLKPEARPMDADPRVVVSPCDGTLTQYGRVENLQLEQVKGRYYSAADLLRSEYKAGEFSGGHYATFYLSPRDYHRVHFPCFGEVSGFHYIPGRLFPVNPPAVRSIDNLFPRNERLIVYLSAPAGPVAVVMVGAACVGFITQSYDAARSHFKRGQESKKHYLEPIAVRGGEELGIFHLGSTVILLFVRDTVEFVDVERDARVCFGQRIGRWLL